MIVKVYKAVFIVLCLSMSSCTSKRDTVSNNIVSEIYLAVQKKLEVGNYLDAIKDLKTLNHHCLVGPYAQYIQLDLIYAYYKSSNLSLAKSLTDYFLQLYPADPSIDYVLYMRGLINMALSENALQDFFGIDRFDRNPALLQEAFSDFKKLIQTFPNSQYSMDASKRLIYLKNQLAKHFLSVIKYYSRRNEYTTVVIRTKEMLKDFPDTQATRIALTHMERAYRKMHLSKQADIISKIITLNEVK
ncbi:outer membrane protein assembly factor BamD [Sodalis sp. CWE]|uniref:outer membrane protein assembly factor BamD n=1 Tax=Sodalis sp. CWE TaxID=2803816 RepID=UPI001C7CB45F|nr:outer membrane protein assembly factor BamD [Sodalis sp. CWE]MBX4180977.1 outer membrane protein assembly factor BamD [Sodalis sp. CWE]